jgi:polysaccharide chain length determinant protein (PEP-CTERM system associated)
MTPTAAAGWKPYGDLLRRRRRVALWSSIATLAVSGAFVLGLPELYRASATLLVQGQMPEAFVQPTVPGEVNSRLQVLKQEALSRGRLAALIERFHLYGTLPGQQASDAALARLERDVRVDVTSDTTRNGEPTAVSFTVSYAATDPRTAANVANALAAFYVGHNEETRVQQASQATATIGAQVADTRAQMDAQAARIRGYTSRNIGALPQQIDANLSAINRLDAQFQRNGEQLLRLVETRQQLQNDLAAIDTRVPAADDNTPASQLVRARADLADLRTRFSDAHPDVREARAKVTTLERAQAAATGRGFGGSAAPTPRSATQRALDETESQIARLERDQTSLRNEIAMYQRRVETAPANEPAFDSLVRDYQATRDRFDVLQRRHDEALLAERAESGGGTRELRLLDAAVPPSVPTGPARGVLLGLSVLLALAVGVVVALAVDWTDTSFHSLDDLRAFTKVPVLASIPEIITARGRGRTREFALACARLVALGALALGAFHLAHLGDRVVRVLSRVG